MSTTLQPKPGLPPRQGFKTSVSKYDQVSGMLTALILLIGFLFLVMGLLYLSKIVRYKPKEVQTLLIDDLPGNDDRPEGIADDFEEPGVEELADVPEPQLADAIAALTDAPSTQAAAIEAVDGNMKQMGTGKGLGDKRQRGPGGGGNADIIPDGERWAIRYTSDEITYSIQLDYFGIELAALARGANTIQYAFNVSKDKPDQKTSFRGKEPRVYFMHRPGSKLRRWDDRLMTKAGINLKNKIKVQFIPGRVRSILLGLESKAKGAKSLSQVKKTTFGVRAKGADFEYYVIDIKYRF